MAAVGNIELSGLFLDLVNLCTIFGENLVGLGPICDVIHVIGELEYPKSNV